MGTMLVKHGLPRGHNPELWMLSNPEEIKKIHQAYLEAGSQVILTNTFGANSLKLQEYQASSRVEEINITAAKLAREAVTDKAYIAGTVGPAGQFPAPLGNISWTELVEVFKEQVIALEKGGVDFIFLETFSDLGEIRAALYAAKNYTQLPVACSLTYTEGRTLTGTNPETAAVVLSAMGADLIGANCSTGPQELLEVMKAYRKATHLPLLVEPNAGMPEIKDGFTVYNESPQSMASYVESFRLAGVSLIGACCGSTPAHIKAMYQALNSPQPLFSKGQAEDFPTRLASRTKTVLLGKNELPLIIGERINPTARKTIAQAFKEGNWSLIIQEGKSQLANGAQLLDLNVGIPGCDESILLADGVQKLQASLDCPLVLDCTKPEALEKGLQEFQGKALINSVNGEKKSLQNILPLAKKYGAAVIGLTLNERGIPEKAEERLIIAEEIVNTALSYGIPKEDIVIDCLVLTAAASPDLARETCKAINMVKQHLGVTTVLGLSNVSHGLPQRSWLNAAFLALCLGAGLDTAIANPLDTRIKETLSSTALLAGRDPNAKNYLTQAETVKNISPATTVGTPEEKKDISNLETLSTYIFEAQKEPIVPLLKELIKSQDIVTIINQAIIPPLEKIGELFSDGEIFLPQLIHAGEATKIAFSFLKEQLPDNDLVIESKGTVVIGTVQGDVHDIGKNIVSALLENHGYTVIDLGKNVPAPLFIEAAKKEQAQIIALSALMTTTMVEMKPIIDNIRRENLPVKIIVGGAVVTADYAKEIGADGYGKDAVEAVKIIQKLLKSS